MRVVIDTNIVVKAARDLEPDHLRVILSVSDRQTEHRLVLDHERRLLGEYEDNLRGTELYRKWLKELLTQRKVEWSSGRLDARHRRELSQRGLHEPEDHVVVALAWHTGKYVVTEDSDFGKGDSQRAQVHRAVLDYLTNTMGLTVHTAGEALSVL